MILPLTLPHLKDTLSPIVSLVASVLLLSRCSLGARVAAASSGFRLHPSPFQSKT